jgi:hypothetical protein
VGGGGRLEASGAGTAWTARPNGRATGGGSLGWPGQRWSQRRATCEGGPARGWWCWPGDGQLVAGVGAGHRRARG